MLRRQENSNVETKYPSYKILDLTINTVSEYCFCYAFILNQKAPIEAKEWLVSILQKNHLTVSLFSSSDDVDFESDLILLVSCDDELLEATAKRVYMPHQLRRQNNFNGDCFKNLTISEQQRILLFLIEKIHLEERSTLIGIPDVTIYPGQSIVHILHRGQVILNYFPFHDLDNLKLLSFNNCSAFVNRIDSVRNYFGEKIGFYFAFLNFYHRFFMIISIFSLISCCFRSIFLINELYTIAICVSIFVFLKFWKRNSNWLACKWGTIEVFELESPRFAFRSKGIIKDPVTDELVPFYPIQKTWYKEYLISLPFVIFCLYISFEIMCLYFEIENIVLGYHNEDPTNLTSILTYLPSIVYALLVTLMNYAYRIVATKLNDYENHRTQLSHENHWIIKLVLYEFANNFMSLFYIAFYLKDMAMLKWNLITMLTINQAVDNLIEFILPLLHIYCSKRLKNIKTKAKGLKSQFNQILDEKDLDEYEDTYYDYLELFIQFGYTFLFVAVFPLGPILAFINSWIEIRIDALKLCYSVRRPFQRTAKSINKAWMISFEAIAILVVISNSLVLCIISDPIRDISLNQNMSSFEFIVYGEHLLFISILIFWYIVPDTPKEVNLKLMRQKYSNIKKSFTD